jgi:Protein of unknown function (DUF4058)
MPNHRLYQIESNHLWPDFHAKFLNYWQESLMDALPREYEARIGEQVCLFSSSGDQHRVVPDISLVRTPSVPYDDQAESRIQTAILDHVAIEEELRWRHLEITHRADRRLVAVLELLSPSNKVEPGRTRYLIKRNEFLLQPVHLIEVDLLTGGHRLPHQQALPSADYYVFVSRAEARFKCLVMAWSGDAPLPSISIPLLPSDREILSPLQYVFDTVYQKGRY